MIRRALMATILAAGCGGSEGRLGEGEVCAASTECTAGLVCDFNQSPPRCAGMLTPVPDAAPVPDVDPLAPDAPPPADAPPGAPDAAPVPDAPPPPVDGAVMPDAPPPPVDAAPPPVDAAVSDAA